jgi:hypothetical protein
VGDATKKRGGRASEAGDAVAVLAAFQLSTTVITIFEIRFGLALLGAGHFTRLTTRCLRPCDWQPRVAVQLTNRLYSSVSGLRSALPVHRRNCLVQMSLARFRGRSKMTRIISMS